MPELSEVTPDMSPADVRRLIVQRGGTIPPEEALVSILRHSPWVNPCTCARLHHIWGQVLHTPDCRHRSAVPQGNPCVSHVCAHITCTVI